MQRGRNASDSAADRAEHNVRHFRRLFYFMAAGAQGSDLRRHRFGDQLVAQAGSVQSFSHIFPQRPREQPAGG